MIHGFAIASTAVATIICVLCGMASYSLAHDNSGGDYGNAIGAVMSVMCFAVALIAGLFAVVGGIVLAVGGGQ